MLRQSCRRWTNIKTTLDQGNVFAGIKLCYTMPLLLPVMIFHPDNAQIFCINHGDQSVFFQFEIITYVFVRFMGLAMGLWSLEIFYFLVGTIFLRQNLASTDVRF